MNIDELKDSLKDQPKKPVHEHIADVARTWQRDPHIEYKMFVYDNADPPRRLMEERLEQLLADRGEHGSVIIEYKETHE